MYPQSVCPRRLELSLFNKLLYKEGEDSGTLKDVENIKNLTRYFQFCIGNVTEYILIKLDC